MGRRAALAGGVYALALVLFALFVVLPFATKERAMPAEVPSPPALRVLSFVPMRAGARTCMGDVAVTPQSRAVTFRATSYGKPTPALRVTVTSSGYRASGSIAAGFPDNASLSVAIPAPRSSRLATVCVRNTGPTRIALDAAADSAHSRAQTTVDGRPVYPTPALRFDERRPVSFVDRAGVTAGRIAVFRGFADHAWIVWLLAIATLVGVPVLAGLALLASERQRRSDSSAE